MNMKETGNFSIFSNDLLEKRGIGGKDLENFTELMKLEGKKDMTLNVPIEDGYGSKSKEVTTCWKTLHGYGEIIFPEGESTWDIVIKNDGNVFLNEKGLKCPRASCSYTQTNLFDPKQNMAKAATRSAPKKKRRVVRRKRR